MGTLLSCLLFALAPDDALRAQVLISAKACLIRPGMSQPEVATLLGGMPHAAGLNEESIWGNYGSVSVRYEVNCRAKPVTVVKEVQWHPAGLRDRPRTTGF